MTSYLQRYWWLTAIAIGVLGYFIGGARSRWGSAVQNAITQQAKGSNVPIPEWSWLSPFRY